MEVGDFTNLNTSNVIDMNHMFYKTGYFFTELQVYTKELKLTGLDNWDTSKVVTMYAMFSSTGYNAGTKVNPNVSGWSVPLVANYDNFNQYATWITPPTWVN